MKKVFWTSIVWIILILGFVAYMRWFGQPVAEKVAGFIAPSFNCPVVDCDVPVCEPCDCELQCPECITNCEECPEVEPAECNCPATSAGTVVEENTENWTNLFDQLDRIEKSLKANSSELTDEELFEEFKARREANQ